MAKSFFFFKMWNRFTIQVNWFTWKVQKQVQTRIYNGNLKQPSPGRKCHPWLNFGHLNFHFNELKTSVIYFNTFSVWLSLKSLMSFSVALTCIHTWLSCIILSALGKALNSNALRTTSFKSVLCFTSRSLNASMNCFLSVYLWDQLINCRDWVC